MYVVVVNPACGIGWMAFVDVTHNECLATARSLPNVLWADGKLDKHMFSMCFTMTVQTQRGRAPHSHIIGLGCFLVVFCSTLCSYSIVFCVYALVLLQGGVFTVGDMDERLHTSAIQWTPVSGSGQFYKVTMVSVTVEGHTAATDSHANR